MRPGTTSPGTTLPGTTLPGTTSRGTTSPGTISPGTTLPGTAPSGTTSPGIASGTTRGKLPYNTDGRVRAEESGPDDSDRRRRAAHSRLGQDEPRPRGLSGLRGHGRAGSTRPG